MSNLILLQVPHSPGPKHNRSSSVYSRNSCDSNFSAYTGTTLVAETCPTILRTLESRLSCAGPCDGTVFYIYDKPLPPLPQEALVQKQKPLPPLPLNISRRRSHHNIRSPISEPENHIIYYDEKEVYVHNPFSDEKVVMIESWDDKKKFYEKLNRYNMVVADVGSRLSGRRTLMYIIRRRGTWSL